MQLTRAKFLTDAELSVLQGTLLKYESKHPRDVALIRVALETGARASEVLRIRFQDLDQSDSSVFIHALKKGRNRQFPLSYGLFARLLELRGDRSVEERVFPISYARLYQIWLEWRPCEKGFHSLRHCKGISLYRSTKDMRLVAQVLGHRSLTSTQVYTEFLYSVEELRALTAK